MRKIRADELFLYYPQPEGGTLAIPVEYIIDALRLAGYEVKEPETPKERRLSTKG